MRNLLVPIVVILIGFTACKKDKVVSPTSPPFTPEFVSSPADFLTAANYDKLIIQVVYVEGGQPPSQTVIGNLTSFLQLYLNKPSGIEVTQNSIVSPGKTVFSLDDIKALEKTNRTPNTANRVLTAYVFFANGDYDQNSGNQKVLGVTYDFSSLVIFDKTIRDISGRLGQPSSESVETSVLEHEFGHVLGLVNNGTSMAAPHEDGQHEKHCNNKNCLMYWNTETSDMIANLTGNTIPVLDVNCVNDLKAAGSK